MSPRDKEGNSTFLWNDGTSVTASIPLYADVSSFVVMNDAIVVTLTDATTMTIA